MVWHPLAHSNPWEDKGVRQSLEEGIKNPSEAAIATQVEKAAKAWQELESEESLISQTHSHSHGSSNPTGGHGSSRQPAPKAKGKAAAKSKPKIQPIIYAAKQRAKTAKDFADVERALKKAKDVAEKILVEVAPKLLGDTFESDTSLQLLRSRLELVTLAQDERTGKAAIDLGKDLYNKSMADPYLKDLSMTLFTDPSSVQTIGALSYVRRVTLDLPLNHWIL